MKKENRFRRLPACLAGILCLLLCLQAPVQALEATDLRYGKGIEGDVVLQGGALFDALFASDAQTAPLSQLEREALDALSEAALEYNSSIPDSVIQRDYNGDTGVLTISVQSYRYVAENGQTVVWLPTTLIMDDGAPLSLNGPDEAGIYTYVFTDVWHSDELRIQVDFAWEVEIPAETADGLLTLPYRVASETRTVLDAYETAKKIYDTELGAYQTYLKADKEYSDKKTAYDNYVIASQAHADQKAKFDSYVLEKAAYDQSLKDYAAYLEKKKEYDKKEKEYYDYEEFRKQYESIYDEYERYTKELEGALSRLAILESMFVSDSHKWQFYGGVMGSTVDSVLNSRDELSLLATDQRYIDAAQEATEALRPLLKEYAKIRSASYKTKLERYRAEFAYYNEHYEQIRDQIKKLFNALFSIYSAATIQTAMATHPATKPKLAHFQQFLGQMYVLHCALNDGVTLDPNTTIPNLNINIVSLVEEKIFVADTDKASPVGVTLPEAEVKLPGDGSFPEPVEKPVKDFEDMEDPAKKGAPTVVKDPGKPPAEVKHPGEPPKEVFPPEGEEPTAPVFSEIELALAQALKDQALEERLGQNRAHTLQLLQRVSCTRYISNRKTVTFYDAGGKPLQTVVVEYGDRVTAPDMTRPADDRYSYVFLGWVDFNAGDDAPRADLQSVKSDLSLRPVYHRTERLYEVVWVLEDRRHAEYYPWDATPICPVATTHPSKPNGYRFVGWSQAISPVAGNVTYTAQYEEIIPSYQVTWVVGNRTETVTCLAGTMPTCPLSTELAVSDRLYRFEGWNQVIREVRADVTYTARFTEIPLGSYNDGSLCLVEHTDTEVRLVAQQPILSFAGASEYARSVNKNLVITWDRLTVTLTPARLKELETVYCTKLECTSKVGNDADVLSFRFRYLNSVGHEISFSKGLSVSLPYTPADGMTVMAYRISGEKRKEIALTRYAEGRAVLTAPSGAQILFRPEYQLQYSDPSQNCNLTALPALAGVGDEIDLRVNCSFGYEISSVCLTFADGRQQTMQELSFTMPQGAVSVQLNVTKIVYHVSFVANDAVIWEKDLFFGDEVPLPPDPVKAEDDQFTYRFSGWTPYVTRATGEDRNPVYTASFSRTPKHVEELPEFERDPFLYEVLPRVILILLVLVVAVTLSIVFRKGLKVLLTRLGVALWKLLKLIAVGLVCLAKYLAPKLHRFLKLLGKWIIRGVKWLYAVAKRLCAAVKHSIQAKRLQKQQRAELLADQMAELHALSERSEEILPEQVPEAEETTDSEPKSELSEPAQSDAGEGDLSDSAR